MTSRIDDPVFKSSSRQEVLCAHIRVDIGGFIAGSSSRIAGRGDDGMKGLLPGLRQAWDDWNQVRVRVKRSDVRLEVVTENLQGLHYRPPADAIVELSSVHFQDVDFSSARFTQGFVASNGSTFERCDLRRLRSAGGNLSGGGRQTKYRDCLFGASISNCMPFDARFERCHFEDLKDWLAIQTEFVDCTFTGGLRLVRFSGKPVNYWSRGFRLAKLNPPRQMNDFRGNDFREADMFGVSFVFGIDLDRQLLPSGPEYVRLKRFPERARQARLEIEQWSDSDAAKEALLVLEGYLDMCKGLQQDDLFARRDEMPAPPEVLERLWRLLGRITL